MNISRRWIGGRGSRAPVGSNQVRCRNVSFGGPFVKLRVTASPANEVVARTIGSKTVVQDAIDLILISLVNS